MVKTSKIVIPDDLPKEITDFYTRYNNTFIAKDTKEPNNMFEIEIGDILSNEFQPQLKIKRWDNECNFSIKLIDNDTDIPILKTDKNKIKFVKNNKEVHFYNVKQKADMPDCYEFEIVLKEPAKTNIIQMSIETKGLNFYYQPGPTQEEIDEGSQIRENVIGSYAVYHESKQGDYSQIGGKNYMVGKAFHIYRPKIIDNAGTEVWGKLNITDNLLIVEIPQDFLDNAVYPVIVDPTFGFETIGGTLSSPSQDICGGKFNLNEDGNATSISVYIDGSFAGLLKCAIYNADLSFVAGTEERDIPLVAGWYDFDFASAESLVAGDYILVAWGPLTSYAGYMTRDTNISVDRWYEEVAYGSWPANLNASDRTGRFSIYCTYTAVGWGAKINNISPGKVNGVAVASIGKIVGV